MRYFPFFKFQLFVKVMYIWTYKKNEIVPELTLDDLWEIQQLDLEWGVIYKTRKNLMERLSNLDDEIIK